MTEFILNQFEDKKVCLLGFGAEGQSSYRIIRKFCPHQFLTIADRNEQIVKHLLLCDDENAMVISGEDYLKDLNRFDLILRSPGISFSLLKETERVRISSQTELLLRAFRMQIIGITGTKGKSTTSSLIHHIILQHTPNVLLVGNIGVPPFEMLDRIDEKTIIVCELSSHQLENLFVSPHTAILLNIFEEHLDHYPSFHHYQLAKFNIARYQEEDDCFIFNADDDNIKLLIDEYIPQGKLLPYSFTSDLDNGCILNDYDILFKSHEKVKYIFDTTGDKNLKGDHNLMNIMAAICACKIHDIPDHVIDEGIKSFLPLEHRIEYVGKFEGVDFYNDSIATIPEATIAAVKSLNNVDTIILGGLDRGVDYSALMDFLMNSVINNFVFLGEAGKRMMQLLPKESEKKNIFSACSMEEAVGWAKKHTEPKKTCLLSPAAASYDVYKNFAERGMDFKQLARN